MEFTKPKDTESSKYLRFHLRLMGWDFYLNGNKVSRWELFARNQDLYKLLNGMTKYQKEERPPNAMSL